MRQVTCHKIITHRLSIFSWTEISALLGNSLSLIFWSLWMQHLSIGGIKASDFSWMLSSWKMDGISLISKGFAWYFLD
jgi:hypothetical protein